MALSNQPQRALPSDSVASFKNQQLGGLITGTSGVPGPTSPTQIALGQRAKPLSAVQQSAQRQTDAVRQRSTQLVQLTQATAQKRQAAQAAQGYGQQQPQTQGGVRVGQQGGGGGGNVGQAYKPNGALSDARNFALREASSYVGGRYVLGGTSRNGIDCSGLVMMVYNQLGYKLPHHAGIQGRQIPGTRTNVANLRPGDLVAWRDGSHIAIYAGNGEIIEAANPRRGVVRRKIWAPSSAIYGVQLKLPGE